MSTPPLRILLVEDNAADAALLELALRKSHYGEFEVARSRRLEEAFSHLVEQPFDAILLDLGLPDSQGLQTLKRMRAKAAQVPIIVLTGLADEEQALGAMQLGAQDYLFKSEIAQGGVARSVRYVYERTKAERASQQVQRHLELAVEAAQIGIWDWDLLKDEVVWSSIQARILGVEGRECVFQTFDECVHPEDRAETHKKARDAVQSREPFRHEYRVVWPDGTVHWIEGRGRALCDEQGNARRMVGTVVDITQRKAAEETAKVREADMAHLLRVSTMAQMASGLAHELNQPLGAILNYAGMCLSQLGSRDVSTERLGDALREVMNETRRADAIIKRMRDFVRKQRPRAQSIDLNQLAEQVRSLMQFELRRRKIRCVMELATDLRPAIADPVQIEQVLVNLVYNALEAIDQGPSSARQVTIRTALDMPTTQAYITVADTGPGISLENLKRLFEPFFSTKPEGLGMGLNISRSIVESYGGRLSAAPGPRGGMQFSFTLPLENVRA
jgi:PAS domain S-box-containing protein